MADFVVAALAVYGLAYAITSPGMEGPFGLFVWIRERTAKQRNWFERGLHCVICVSFWVGAAMALFLYGISRATIVNWLGYFGFAVVLTVILNRVRERNR